MADRKPYPTDVSDEEWAFVAPYLILFPLDAGQRRHDLREVFNALRYVVRTGCPWRMLPNDLPPWSRVHQQMQRWFKAGCFEAIVHDLRMLLRLADGRTPHPSTAILDSRTLQSTPTSGARAGYDGAKRKKGQGAGRCRHRQRVPAEARRARGVEGRRRGRLCFEDTHNRPAPVAGFSFLVPAVCLHRSLALTKCLHERQKAKSPLRRMG